MTTLGEAWIEVHADTTPFNRELGLKIKEAIRGTDKVVDKESIKTGKKISEGVTKGFDKDSNRIKRSFHSVGDFLKLEGNRWEKNLTRSFEKMARGNFILTRIFGQMALAATKVGKAIIGVGVGLFNLGRGMAEVIAGVGIAAVEGFKNLIGVGGDLARATTAISTGFARMGAALAAAVTEIASFLPAAAAMAAILTILAGAFGVLLLVLATVAAPFATLLNFALLIPAALTAVLAIILPLVIALHNLSDVFKLIGEKDSKKFEEGLKKLSPTLQTLTLLLRNFMPMFNQIRDSIQKSFFDPIIKQLGPTLKAIGPILGASLGTVAESLGALIAQVLKFIASPQMQVFLMSVIPMVAAMINAFAPQLITILSALAAAAQAAMPMLLDLVAQFGGFLVQFATWIQGAITDGRFEQWIQDGKDALSAIWGLVKALIDLFGTLFANLKAGGNDFLKILTDAITKFTAWLKSPEGQKAMENMVRLAKLVAQAFGAALNYVQLVLGVMNKIAAVWDWITKHKLSGLAGGSVNGHNPLTGIFGAIGGFSGGGVVPHDQIAMVHQGEPILDPANSMQKNQQILADAGMLDVLSGQEPVVNVYLGTERLDERIDFRVGKNSRRQAQALTAGARG